MRERLAALHPSAILRRLARVPGEEESGDPRTPGVPLRTILRRFWPYARPFRGWFAVSLVFVAFGPLIQTIEIWLFQAVVDEVLVPRDLAPLPMLAFAFIGLTIASGVIGYVDDVLSTRVAQGFLVSVRTSLFRHLMSLSPDSLDQRRMGDVLTRITGDVGAIESFVISGAADAIAAVAKIAFFTIALFLIDPALAAISLAVAPLFWGTSRYFSSWIRGVSRAKRRRSSSLTSVAEQALANLALVQASNRQADEVDRFHAEGRAIMAATLASVKLRGLLMPLVALTELIGTLIVIGLGTVALAEGRLTLGSLLVFLTFLSQLYGPVRALADLTTSLYAAAAGAERIIELLDMPTTVADPPTSVDPGRARGSVEFEGVTYRYPGATRNALSDLTFTIEPGRWIAVVGRSGAGKSTLVKLLLRFMDPTDGSVRVDGHDLRTLRLAGVRGNVGVLLQESLIFDGSVAENLRYGRPDATDEDLERAILAADASEFISALPERSATRIGQRGRQLSGGQRQRIGIARLFVRDTPILVLDEPSAALDPTTSGRILEATLRLMAGRTTIIISHDLLLARAVDEIVVLEEGRIVERGDHDQLIEAGRTYAELWDSSRKQPPLGDADPVAVIDEGIAEAARLPAEERRSLLRPYQAGSPGG